jgi:hypothetical protein
VQENQPWSGTRHRLSEDPGVSNILHGDIHHQQGGGGCSRERCQEGRPSVLSGIMRWIDRPTGTGFGGLWVVDALKISIEDTQDGTDGRDTISLCSVGYSLCDYSHRNNRSTRNHQLKIPFRKAPRGCKPKKLRNEPQRFQHGVTQIIEFDWKPCACIGVLELSWQARPASPFRSMGGWWQLYEMGPR